MAPNTKKGRSKKSAAEPAEEVEKEGDVAMEDAPESTTDQQQVDEPEEDGEQESNIDDIPDDEEDTRQRVRMLPGSTEHAASFEFIDEDHTLGNALRYIVMKNPEVEFCAYAIPHPSEPKMNLRIQTYGGMTAEQALNKGLKDLEDLCDVVSEKFWDARNRFSKKDDIWEPPRDLRLAEDANEAA